MNMHRVLSVLPKETGTGRRGVLRNRPDVGEIVVDLVLGRRSGADIAKRTGVDYETVQRFKKRFLTDEVRKVVLAESQQDEANKLDAQINAGQDEVQHGLRSIIDEQKKLYKEIRANRDLDGNEGILAMLLRDQGQSLERLLKSYTALKEKTTIVLSINESPEWSKLQEVLYATFAEHPEAFDTFRALTRERRLRLE